MHGDKPLIYLDSANTSQKPRKVLDALTEFYERHNANIHRAVYQLAAESTEAYEGARTKLATFLGAPEGSREIVFTKSCTEAINLVAYAWGRANLREGDEIVISEMEHHSNLIPWQIAAQMSGAKIVPFPITDEGLLDLDAMSRVITDRTKIVCVTGMSNVLGTINSGRRRSPTPPTRSGRCCSSTARSGRRICATNVAELGADFYAFTGHKMLRADRLRRAVGARRAARGDAAVPRRGRDDPRGLARPRDLQRDPAQVRGRHPAVRADRSGSAQRSTT